MLKTKFFEFIKQHRLLITILFFGIIFRLALAAIHLSDPTYSIQQDGYAEYSKAMANGTLSDSYSYYERRLLPGYPILIILLSPLFTSHIIAGLFISITSSIAVSLLVWKISKNLYLTGLISFFPPMWIEQSAEVANEPVFVLFCLLGIYIFLKKKFTLSGILVGIAFDIRIVGMCLFAAIAWYLVTNKQRKQLVYFILGFIVPILFLLGFNYMVFGRDEIFQQFVNTDRFGNVRFGLTQLIDDIYRTLDWGQYKILLSGVFYVVTTMVSLIGMFLFRKKYRYSLLFFYWMLFSLVFIFSFSPFTLLENFGRYSLAVVPAYCLGLLLVAQPILERIPYWQKAKNRSLLRGRKKTESR